ncbi:MAG: light-harvesting antenna LH1, beta subunit [Tagaea sp.]
MAENPERVWPTGLTRKEAEELHKNLIDGTRIFGLMSLLAHLLAYMYTPWLQ